MSSQNGFVSVFDLDLNVNRMSRRERIDQTQRFSEETRQEQAYNDYRQVMRDSYQPDQLLEDDFFGNRRLSISDFDGTRTIVTPSRLGHASHQSGDEFAPFPINPRNGAVTVFETSPSPRLSLSRRHQFFSNAYLDDTRGSRSPDLIQSPRSPLYGVDGFSSDHPPTPEEVRQKHIEALEAFEARSPLPSPSSSTPPPYWTRYISPVTQAPTKISCDTNYDDSDIEAEDLDNPLSIETPIEYARNTSNNHNYMLPDSLRRLIRPSSVSECSSIRVIGSVDCPIVIEDDADERASLASESADIEDVSTPELILDDDIDDLDVVNTIELGYDASPSTLHFFSQAGVHITTRDLQEDFVAAQSTNLAGGYLEIDQVAEDEKARANIDFFEHSQPLRNSATVTDHRHLIPGVVDDLADPDYYLGPDAKAIDDSIFDRPYNESTTSLPLREESIDPKSTNTIISSRPVLQQQTVASPFGNLFQADSTDYSFSDHSRISKTPIFQGQLNIKKRAARESFDLIELCDENARREFSYKKARLMSDAADQPACLPSTPISAVSTVFACSPMATALQGYAGQFDLHLPEMLPCTKQSTERHVFGNHLHANGEVINLHFITDPSSPASDLSDSPGLRATIEHANLHHTFAEEMPRSSEEEDLRREAHRECAAARLEGVPVGYYRYFAGHMTVEEYVDARMCVCWERCFCSKLCTRFGDLVCPCADNLVVGEDA